MLSTAYIPQNFYIYIIVSSYCALYYSYYKTNSLKCARNNPKRGPKTRPI